jgi:hypothetical protein
MQAGGGAWAAGAALSIPCLFILAVLIPVTFTFNFREGTDMKQSWLLRSKHGVLSDLSNLSVKKLGNNYWLSVDSKSEWLGTDTRRCRLLLITLEQEVLPLWAFTQDLATRAGVACDAEGWEPPHSHPK